MKKIEFVISIMMMGLLALSSCKKDNPAPIVPVTSISLSATAGAIGKAIDITGNAFSSIAANNMVKFNGTVASITNASATKISVIVPYGATTGKVTVDVNGNTLTSASDFTIVKAWTKKADMPVAHENGFAFAIEGVGYFGGPYVGSSYTTLFYKYNNINDSWAQLNNLPETFANFGLVAGTTGYGGYNNFYSYNVANDQWSQSTATVPGINSNLSIFFTINSKSYAVDPANGTWEFDPAGNNNQGTWTKLSASNNYPEGASAAFHKAFVIGGDAYVGGGYNNNNPTNTFYKFTPGSGWSTLNNLPASGFIEMFSNGQYGYLLYATNSYRYNPANDTWIQLEDVQDNASDNTYFNIGQKTYLMTGYTNADSKEVWEYDPSK